MKRRRINLIQYDIERKGVYVPILRETNGYQLLDLSVVGFDYRLRRFHKDGSITSYCKFHETFEHVKSLRWKPHEYRQEARQACLISYWIFKKRLGRDLAGLIAKYVYSTRFDEIWENEKEEN